MLHGMARRQAPRLINHPALATIFFSVGEPLAMTSRANTSSIMTICASNQRLLDDFATTDATCAHTVPM